MAPQETIGPDRSGPGTGHGGLADVEQFLDETADLAVPVDQVDLQDPVAGLPGPGRRGASACRGRERSSKIGPAAITPRSTTWSNSSTALDCAASSRSTPRGLVRIPSFPEPDANKLT